MGIYISIAFRHGLSFCIDIFFGLLLIWGDISSFFDFFDVGNKLTVQESSTIFVAVISASVIFVRFFANFEEYRKRRIERKKTQYDFERQKEIDLINLNKENEQRESNTD